MATLGCSISECPNSYHLCKYARCSLKVIANPQN